jgi:hypothetical protein
MPNQEVRLYNQTFSQITPKSISAAYLMISQELGMQKYFSTESGTRICHQLRSPGYFNSFLNEDINDLNFHKAKAKENNQAFVLSNEFFSLFDAPQWSVGQLKELFPEGKNIIIIRRQQDIINSVYKHQGREISVAPRNIGVCMLVLMNFLIIFMKTGRRKIPFIWYIAF